MRTCSLVFLDIDGTLLDSQHHIQPKTKRLLNRLEAQGIPVILCSARSPGGVSTVEEQAGLHSPIACYGGSLLLTAERAIVGDIGIKTELASRFKDFVLERYNGIIVSAYVYDVWLVDDVDHPAIQREARISECTPLAADLHSILQNTPHIHKLLCIGLQQQITCLQTAAVQLFPELTFARSGATYLEVMPTGISKRVALQKFGAYYHVGQESMAAFGDHFVDLEMIKYAGFGVAMGNAPDAVKKAADWVTATNDEEGVYIALKGLKFEPPKNSDGF